MVQMSAILPNFAGFTISRGVFHLRMIEEMGSGAYGVVYLAEDVSPGGPHGAPHYAVKCLLRHPDGSDLARQQRRELAYHREMSEHPNVVTLHATIEEEFYTFLVLDLCEGGDLFNAIMQRSTYVNNTEAVKHTFLQIIDALEACHENGIYHRDIKPENILCSKDDQQVYLADFGLSTRSRRSTNFGCGSSFYMSPECLGIYHKKKPYLTAPSDVWALGTVLCNLITGRNPWHIASPKIDQGFRLYLREGPAWLANNLPLSAGAADIMGRIFDLDPGTRITLPELRVAINALETFYPGAEPSTSSTTVDAPQTVAIDATESAQLVVSASVQAPPARPANAPGFHNESWELHPVALSAVAAPADLTPSTAAVLSVTLAGTVSTFVNDFSHDVGGDDDAAAASSALSDTHTLDDVWSISGPPPLGISPEPSSDASEDSDSAGPVTPETAAVDSSNAAPVPELTLDGSPGADVALASARLEEMKTDKKRRGSFSRLMDGVRRFRIRA